MWIVLRGLARDRRPFPESGHGSASSSSSTPTTNSESISLLYGETRSLLLKDSCGEGHMLNNNVVKGTQILCDDYDVRSFTALETFLATL